MKVNEEIATQKLQYINVTEVPCPRAEWYSPMRKVLCPSLVSHSTQVWDCLGKCYRTEKHLRYNNNLRKNVHEKIKKAYQNRPQKKYPKIF